MDDETREFLRLLTDRREPAPVPRDVVPTSTSETEREGLLRLNAIADTWREVTVPGEVIEDVNGVPTAMTEATTETVYDGGGTVTSKQLAAAGLTPADVPKLTVIDPPQRKGTDHG